MINFAKVKLVALFFRADASHIRPSPLKPPYKIATTHRLRPLDHTPTCSFLFRIYRLLLYLDVCSAKVGSVLLKQGWPTFHLPCVNFLLYGFRCATISINPGASISLPCRVCLQKQRFVRGCKLRVITTRLQCATSNHAMRHLMAHTP